MLHVGEAFDHIAHALHYTDAAGMDERITPRRVASDAGRFLYGIRAWLFAERMTGTGSLVADQNTIDLPLGVSSIIDIVRVPSTATGSGYPWRITRTTQADIALQISINRPLLDTTQPVVYLWAPSSETDQFTPNGLALTATVWPTPTVSSTDGLLVTFRAKWEEIPSDDLDDINDWTLPIPEYAEQLYLSILRETAKGYELDGGGTVEQRLAAVTQWPSFVAAVMEDKRIAMVSGRLRNTAVDQARCYGVRGRRDYPIVVNLTDLINPTQAT